MKYTNQFIGCCGLDCEKCDARIATITNDNALREKTAALWTKLNGVTITPEMINCTGCRIAGAKTPFCDKFCPVHNCVREKESDTCADCGRMDECPTLGIIATNNPFVLENLKKTTQRKAEPNKIRTYDTPVLHRKRHTRRSFIRSFRVCRNGVSVGARTRTVSVGG